VLSFRVANQRCAPGKHKAKNSGVWGRAPVRPASRYSCSAGRSVLRIGGEDRLRPLSSPGEIRLPWRQSRSVCAWNLHLQFYYRIFDRNACSARVQSSRRACPFLASRVFNMSDARVHFHATYSAGTSKSVFSVGFFGSYRHDVHYLRWTNTVQLRDCLGIGHHSVIEELAFLGQEPVTISSPSLPSASRISSPVMSLLPSVYISSSVIGGGDANACFSVTYNRVAYHKQVPLIAASNQSRVRQACQVYLPVASSFL